MPIFRVPVKFTLTEIYHVEAETAEKAMDAAIHDDVLASEDCELQEVLGGDRDVYLPDIVEVKK